MQGCSVKNKKGLLKKLFLLIPLFCFNLFAEDIYWENPKVVSSDEIAFPTTIHQNNKAFVFWQEIDSKNSQIWLSARVYENDVSFYENKRFAGPFEYHGEVPDIYSVTNNKKGSIVVAMRSNQKGIVTYRTDDDAKTFTESFVPQSDEFLAPRVYYSALGKYIVFLSLNKDNAFFIYTSESVDGINWQPLKEFAPSSSFRNPFVPFLLNTGFNDIVVFQAQYSSSVINRLSYQLFSTVSSDGGITWSEPKLITDQNSIIDSERNFALFQNQRPYLYRFNNKNYIAWERTENISASIFISEITQNGLTPRTISRLTEDGNASRPVIFDYKNKVNVTWFDTSSGKESISVAVEEGTSYWENTTLVQNNYNNLFPQPVILNSEKNGQYLGFIWQRISQNKKNNLCILLPDTSVNLPKLNPISYKKNKRSTAKKVQIQIEFPSDPSGISGFSYTWAKDNTEIPAKKVMGFAKDRKLTLLAEEDGIYTLNVSVADRAGNWSNVASIDYHRDLTPPNKPNIIIPQKDKYGLLSSNTFRLNWEKPEDEDVAGYNYELEYLGSVPSNMAVTKTHPLKLKDEVVLAKVDELTQKYISKAEKNYKFKSNIATRNLRTPYFNNRRNGVYLFSVVAIDEVGNVSDSSSVLLILNKYNPQTYISSAYQTSSDIGELELVINGGGFTYDGTISEIYIDKDGKAPYDLKLYRKDGDFKVVSNTKISNIKIGTSLDEGSYKMCLLHPDRGLHVSDKIVEISQSGTVKIQAEYVYKPRYSIVNPSSAKQISIYLIIVGIISVLIILAIIFTIVSMILNAKENARIEKELRSIVKGETFMKEKLARGQKRRKSLKGKLIFFTVILVILTVLFVSLQNGKKMLTTQEQTLLEGLQARVDVLMESISNGVENFMPTENILELSGLPAQVVAMNEAKYVTILGRKLGDNNTGLKYVWASNDAQIDSKIATNRLVYGESEITDSDLLMIAEKYSSIPKTSLQTANEISKNISNLSSQISSLATKKDEESLTRRNELSEVVLKLRTEIRNELDKFVLQNRASFPYFDNTKLDLNNTDYIFTSPVLYRQGNSEEYIHAVIVMEISTEQLVKQIQDEIKKLITSSLIVAVLAVLIGIFGAIFVASIIVSPIKKLEKHLVKIGETRNKTDLLKDNMKIVIKSNDEIGSLGNAVNKMTHDIGIAAQEEDLQNDGKAVQQAFIPLEKGEGNKKESIAKLKEDKIEFFGYYEGASAVSGDYFDYHKLDNSWYLVIKCDASGHGVPAAIVMTIVATLFRQYYTKWTFKRNGTNVNHLISQINILVESLGLRGKFAAMIVCLYNVDTGELFMSNAGDNIVHIYDSQTKKMKQLTLDNMPAAGVFATDMIAMRGGYKIEKTVLNHGDILYLYTDGIEESNRKLRNPDFSVQQIEKEQNAPGGSKKSAEKEDAKEELGPERVAQIIECVINKKKFVLTKEQNPISNEVLEFDFTKCDGTIDETILALASVEKVFRMVKMPNASLLDTIQVDKKIDSFLSKYFNLYDTYCIKEEQIIETKKTKRNKNNEKKEENSKQIQDGYYTEYAYLFEDEQADDLTMLALKRI